MREAEFLDLIRDRSRDLAAAFPRVLVGPGHDCAVVGDPGGGGSWLLKVDQLVEGRHFRTLPYTPLDLVGRKAIARAISDIAAAGGRPWACLVGAVLPEGFGGAAELLDSLSRWSRHWSCPLVGGDTATWGLARGPMVLSVTVLGVPHAVRGPVLRRGAEIGDGVFVTGLLGGSLDRSTGHGRHLQFEPRLPESTWLCETLGDRLHAMMDISDGLGRDACRMAAASGVCLRLTAGDLPLSPEAVDWRAAAGDGEDYELLFCAPPDGVPRACPETGTPVTRVGTVTPGKGAVLVEPGGGEIDASEMGWEHGQETG
jgi:thiamine-monophosphate kinase